LAALIQFDSCCGAIMPSRHVRNHRTRRDCLGNDPSLLLIAPSPAADHARYFRVAPSNLRVVTNVVHNVHSIPIHENHDRAPLAFITLCGIKAPLTSNRAPSNLIMTGRYILQPQIFDLLAVQKAGAGGEIQLTDAMIALSNMQPFYALKFSGRSFDCGSKVGFLAANVAYALARDDLGSAMRKTIEEILQSSPLDFDRADENPFSRRDGLRVDTSQLATSGYAAPPSSWQFTKSRPLIGSETSQMINAVVLAILEFRAPAGSPKFAVGHSRTQARSNFSPVLVRAESSGSRETGRHCSYEVPH
jgi:hypothetical protein